MGRSQSLFFASTQFPLYVLFGPRAVGARGGAVQQGPGSGVRCGMVWCRVERGLPSLLQNAMAAVPECAASNESLIWLDVISWTV